MAYAEHARQTGQASACKAHHIRTHLESVQAVRGRPVCQIFSDFNNAESTCFVERTTWCPPEGGPPTPPLRASFNDFYEFRIGFAMCFATCPLFSPGRRHQEWSSTQKGEVKARRLRSADLFRWCEADHVSACKAEHIKTHLESVQAVFDKPSCKPLSQERTMFIVFARS